MSSWPCGVGVVAVVGQQVRGVALAGPLEGRVEVHAGVSGGLGRRADLCVGGLGHRVAPGVEGLAVVLFAHVAVLEHVPVRRDQDPRARRRLGPDLAQVGAQLGPHGGGGGVDARAGRAALALPAPDQRLEVVGPDGQHHQGRVRELRADAGAGQLGGQPHAGEALRAEVDRGGGPPRVLVQHRGIPVHEGRAGAGRAGRHRVAHPDHDDGRGVVGRGRGSRAGSR